MVKISFYILLFFSSVCARATNENPLVLPMGEREALLGNAGISIKGSAANALFNPAGLSSLTDTRLSVSGSTYALMRAVQHHSVFELRR
jgi:hypothetical protein